MLLQDGERFLGFERRLFVDLLEYFETFQGEASVKDNIVRSAARICCSKNHEEVSVVLGREVPVTTSTIKRDSLTGETKIETRTGTGKTDAHVSDRPIRMKSFLGHFVGKGFIRQSDIETFLKYISYCDVRFFTGNDPFCVFSSKDSLLEIEGKASSGGRFDWTLKLKNPDPTKSGFYSVDSFRIVVADGFEYKFSTSKDNYFNKIEAGDAPKVVESIIKNKGCVITVYGRDKQLIEIQKDFSVPAGDIARINAVYEVIKMIEANKK